MPKGEGRRTKLHPPPLYFAYQLCLITVINKIYENKILCAAIHLLHCCRYMTVTEVLSYFITVFYIVRQ